jgi:hypothetical protein
VANWERLITFFDSPAELWKASAHYQRHRVAVRHKLLDMAQLRWRRLDGAQLLPLVRAGVKFVDGVGEDRLKTFTHSTDNQPREAA